MDIEVPPKQRFNIAIASPPGFPYSIVFHDLARLLQYSFESLGHFATIQYDRFDPAATNVILGYHLLPTPRGLEDSIIYQLEPLTPEDPRFDPRWLDILRGAREIWDYSPLNID